MKKGYLFIISKAFLSPLLFWGIFAGVRESKGESNQDSIRLDFVSPSAPFYFTWSPDGTKIAFSIPGEGYYSHIWVAFLEKK